MIWGLNLGRHADCPSWLWSLLNCIQWVLGGGALSLGGESSHLLVCLFVRVINPLSAELNPIC